MGQHRAEDMCCWPLLLNINPDKECPWLQDDFDAIVGTRFRVRRFEASLADLIRMATGGL